MYIPKYFELYEIVPKNIYSKYRLNLWFLFDERILKTIDRLRDRYGALSVNNWYWNGRNQHKGWRPYNCTIGAEYSLHKFGRAIDLHSKHFTSEEIRKDIKNDPFCKDFEYITCIEDDTYHLHIDCRNWNKNKEGILVARP